MPHHYDIIYWPLMTFSLWNKRMAAFAAWKLAALCLSVLFVVCHAHDARAELRKYVDEKGRLHLTDDRVAPASMYQYLDEKGRIHLTNDKSRIPSEYSESASAISKSDQDSVVLSGHEEEAFSGDKEDAWLKYKQMGWFEKNALIARAGFADLKGVLDDLKMQLLLIALLFIGLGVFAIVKLKKISHMVSVIVLLLSCYGMVYLSMHIKSTMGRGSDILSNLKQMQSLTQGQAVSSSKGGQGGIMGSLKDLQGMSAERQDLFRMILEEDNL